MLMTPTTGTNSNSCQPPGIVGGDRLQALFLVGSHCRSVRRNTPIYAPGDRAAQLFLVASGEVRISRYSNDGRELVLELLGEGEVFGENGILCDMPRMCQATARKDTLLYVLEKEPLMSALGADPALTLEFTRRMGERHARMEDRLESLVFSSAQGKVAKVLLELAEDHGEATQDGLLIQYPITHQEIGNLIATTRETVSYAFMEFRKAGLISTHRRRTLVCDMPGLHAMAEM